MSRRVYTWADIGTQYDGPHATPTRTNAGPYFMNISSLNNGRLDLNQSDHVCETDFEKWTRRVTPQANDLLFSYETRLGEAALMPDGVEACLGRRMALLRPNTHLVVPRYLLYYYLSPAFQRLIDQNAIHGATVDRISLSTMGSWELELPTLSEQQAIAEVLGALDDKISANTRVAQASALLAIAHYARTAQIEDVRVPLSDLVTTQYGVTTSADASEGPRLLRVTDINKKPWIEWETTPGCTLETAQMEKYILRPGDILVARMADPGKAALIDEGDPTAVFASYLVRLTALDRDYATYIYYFLRSEEYKSYSESSAQGSVQRNMNAKVIAGAKIGLPTRDSLREFNDAIFPLRKSIQVHLRQNEVLARLRDTLLPQLMSGKLRVKDAEQAVDEAV